MRIVETDKAPEPVGAYSQAVIKGEKVYVSGQVGMDPETGNAVSEEVPAQTEQALKNVENVLEAAGTSLDNAIKTTVFITDIGQFGAFNEIYGDYLDEPYPARSAVEVGDIISPFEVEIEMIAALE